MQLSLNVVRASLILSVAVGVLTACQGGFKSKTYSKKEVSDYLATIQGKQNTDGPENAKVSEDPGAPHSTTGVGGGGKDEVIINPTQAESPLAAVVTPTDVANGKTIVDESAQAEAHAKVLAKNSEELGNKNTEADKMVRGIDVAVDADLKITVKAIVNFNHKLQFLSVDQEQIPADANKNVARISVVLKDKPDQVKPNEVKDSVMMGVICIDKDCSQLQVRLDFKIDDNGYLPVVFQVTRGGSDQMTSNLTDAKSYAQALSELDAAAAEALAEQQKNKEDQNKPQAPEEPAVDDNAAGASLAPEQAPVEPSSPAGSKSDPLNTAVNTGGTTDVAKTAATAAAAPVAAKTGQIGSTSATGMTFADRVAIAKPVAKPAAPVAAAKSPAPKAPVLYTSFDGKPMGTQASGSMQDATAIRAQDNAKLARAGIPAKPATPATPAAPAAAKSVGSTSATGMTFADRVPVAKKVTGSMQDAAAIRAQDNAKLARAGIPSKPATPTTPAAAVAPAAPKQQILLPGVPAPAAAKPEVKMNTSAPAKESSLLDTLKKTVRRVGMEHGII